MSKYRIEQGLLHKKKLGKRTLENRIIGKGQITMSYATNAFHYTSSLCKMSIM